MDSCPLVSKKIVLYDRFRYVGNICAGGYPADMADWLDKVIHPHEPTNALDEQGVAMIAQLIRKECQCGALVVVACHDADFVQSVSDVVIQIQAGRVTSVIGK